MKILLLGGGGREHALAWALANSPECETLLVAPGNAGTDEVAQNLDIAENDFDAVKQAVLNHGIEAVIVGPEQPLVNGIVDYFHQDRALKDVAILGPDQQGAQIEGSKAYAKQFMERYGIPTGSYATFESEEIDKARRYLQTLNPPFVVKADGLASGKGVAIAYSQEEALQTIEDYLVKEKLGGAGKQVVIEEFLDGPELSVFILTDGQDYVLLPDAKDYKRVGEGDTGPNTGGMGAISPAPDIHNHLMNTIQTQIIEPTLAGLNQEGSHFKGFLYFGLVLVNNQPYVLEYNVRLGDPEAEVILPRVGTDWLSLFNHTFQSTLSQSNVSIKPDHAATIMMVSGGYPGSYEKGKPITGLGQVQDSLTFHAGTKQENEQVLSAGGRVLAITSLGKSLEEALEKSYKNLKGIQFEHAYYRTDIGHEVAYR